MTIRLSITLLVFAWSFCGTVYGQRISGEIRLRVKDSTGASLEASGLLQSLATGVHRRFQTDTEGFHLFRGLPLGPYHLEVGRPGFSTVAALIEVRSLTPIEKELILTVAPVETEVTVREAADTLTDQQGTSASRYLGPESIDHRQSSTPGRSIVEMVNTQPGWLLEANGVLHPRGSEYAVQYVVDGIPLYDNRSPAFAQSLGVDEYESMKVSTAAYPAEFGRKLGGVIELTTPRDASPGWHGRMRLQGGSYSETSGFCSLQYSKGRNSIGISSEGMATNRYLDPPVLENYTNHGSGGGISTRFDRAWSPSNSTRLYVSTRHTGFLVPNERLQELAGQRQDRTADETLGHVSHTHVFSSRALAQLRFMVRDTSARLWSNPPSTPISPRQDRGFREGYGGVSISVSSRAHELTVGGEVLVSAIYEDFSYRIISYRIDPGSVPIFDLSLPRDFRFKQRADGRDQSAFVQDLWHYGNLALSAGLRFDHHRLIESQTSWSPRLGAAYAIPAAGLVLRGSYDHIFQVPAVENVLLASTNLVTSLGGEGDFLPLKSSRGDFFEFGFTKSVSGKIRLDGNWYRRIENNFGDDSLLLNTGVSFPIAFSKAEIHGYEAKIEVPAWGPFGGFVSYSNMAGVGHFPVAGGLFLGDAAGQLLTGRGSFPISQDQRNSLRSHIRLQPFRRVWFAVRGAYNSGLPFEIEGPANGDFIAAQFGTRILSKVNFERGRVRPSASLDVSAGLVLNRSDRTKMRLQVDVFNLGNRLNLINFSGILSGTALDRGRSFAVRLNTEF